MVGLGGGLLFLPGLLHLSSHFNSRLAFVEGIVISGGSLGRSSITLASNFLLTSDLGGVIYPIVFSQLQPIVGFGGATRIITLIAASSLVIPLACMRKPHDSRERHFSMDLSAWRDPSYTLFALAIFFGFVGLYVPYYHVQAYSIEKVAMSKTLAFYLLPILYAGAFLGRIVSRLLPWEIPTH